jgi:hypothetical protein
MLKVGDKVRNIRALDKTSVGVVALVKVPGMSDCALVRFNPASDGYCIPRSQLEKVAQ